MAGVCQSRAFASSERGSPAYPGCRDCGTHAARMPLGPASRATIRLGLIVLMGAAVAGVWELLAMQSPGTPLYIGMLPGPIAALRELGTVAGLLLLCAGSLLAWAKLEREPKALVVLLHVGVVLGMGAQLYAALHGMHAVQAMDLRPDALPLFVAKYSGLGVFLFALFALGRRVLARPMLPPKTSRPRDDPPT